MATGSTLRPAHAPQQTTGYSIISSVASVLGLIQATPLSEGPQSTASPLNSRLGPKAERPIA
jgi:hypothetical protein